MVSRVGVRKAGLVCIKNMYCKYVSPLRLPTATVIGHRHRQESRNLLPVLAPRATTCLTIWRSPSSVKNPSFRPMQTDLTDPNG